MQIKIYGDSILRKKCVAIREVADEEKRIFQEMVNLMREAGGVGLAACQVGLNKQMLVVDLGDKALKLANPKICLAQGSQSIEEGCLSLPEIRVKVKRAKKIKVKALNEHNQKITLSAEDLLAVVIQHEIDHLKGRLLIDYLPWYRRIGAMRKLKSKRTSSKSESN
ncbi:MAG: peptide deformylase [Candidatus Omnitrophica bacterium]|nr:peptide deformylase [Candidatus Omnitrophota bacterium]